MDKETKKCPFCGEEILVTAKKCKYCEEWLDKDIKDYKIKVDVYIWMATIAIVLFIPMPLGVACCIGALAGIISNVIKEVLKSKIHK